MKIDQLVNKPTHWPTGQSIGQEPRSVCPTPYDWPGGLWQCQGWGPEPGCSFPFDSAAYSSANLLSICPLCTALIAALRRGKKKFWCSPVGVLFHTIVVSVLFEREQWVLTSVRNVQANKKTDAAAVTLLLRDQENNQISWIQKKPPACFRRRSYYLLPVPPTWQLCRSVNQWIPRPTLLGSGLILRQKIRHKGPRENISPLPHPKKTHQQRRRATLRQRTSAQL